MEQIQKADPTARKKAIAVILAGTLIGLAAIAAVDHHAETIFCWLKDNIEWLADHPGMVFLSGWVLVSPLLILSGYLYSYGRRAAGTRRMPPPDCAVTRDTVVKTGRQAVINGRFLQSISAVLFVAAAAIPIIFWYMFEHLVRST